MGQVRLKRYLPEEIDLTRMTGQDFRGAQRLVFFFKLNKVLTGIVQEGDKAKLPNATIP